MEWLNGLLILVLQVLPGLLLLIGLGWAIQNVRYHKFAVKRLQEEVKNLKARVDRLEKKKRPI